MADRFLIAGLGNPGRKYAQTRHNAGFMVLDRLAAQWQCSWSLESRFRGAVSRADRDGKQVMLCKPETYMNESGQSVNGLAAFYQVPPERLVVVVDDADLPLGHARLRPGGSSGGHHGLDSIIQHLGTKEFPRLRVGIGRESAAHREITGYVLSRFSGAEAELMEKVLERACIQLDCWLREGILKAMSLYNGPVPS